MCSPWEEHPSQGWLTGAFKPSVAPRDNLRVQVFLNAEQTEIIILTAHFESPAETGGDPKDAPSSTQVKRKSLRGLQRVQQERWGPPIERKCGRVLFMHLNLKF